jgi:hypothetical protein
MRIRKLIVRKQNGSALLLELAIVAVIGALGAAAAIWQEKQAIEEMAYKAQGSLLKRLRNAADTYVVNNYSELIKNAPAVDGIANPWEPTIADLQAKALLPAGFGVNGIFGQPYRIKIQRLPAGCVDAACTDVAGVVYLGAAINNGPGLGTAMLEIGSDGAYSNVVNPGVLAGMNGLNTVTNPMGNVAGILGASFGYNTGGFAQFLRRDGTLPMTGSLNLEGQKVIKATGVYADVDGSGGVLNLGRDIKIGSETGTANGVARTGTAVVESNVAAALLVKGETKASGLNVTGNGIFGGSLVAHDMFDSMRKMWVSQIAPDIVLKGSQLIDIQSNPNVAKPSCDKPVADNNGTSVDTATPYSTSISSKVSGANIATGVPKIYAIPQAGVIGSYTGVKGTLTSSNNPDGSTTFTQTIDNSDGAVGLFDLTAIDKGTYWQLNYNTRNYAQNAIALVEVACKY